ncbi:MAG: NAD(P)H-dependent oxidoreductase [Alkalibacterium sp.]|uniref:NAD(P)H-dependent FMN reductase n=1 Tax=Alkalibacterium gilvum TaxID=1130080 RepID=A0A1H6VBQ1_9LACT|nr:MULTISPECIES: NAD(P)H-dependent oxidoreductase [Alkalibacterium]MDN6735602.1 NAD(P)H-dependent oxidoreductase [Tetragenococcus koreensis]MDN6293884.1 NAD(P)H-dependent oxidoreductase [Alkalibacterium sp.]MDN6295536.1 NAD(P)H-dependent oxidoreductase [Alkalibacterium sp.]MDN6327060.1 NAD(P)H-dependent oxidoreductase [Alkalibacterium sp.]MDN6385541.1 NAD(P)H-dependent oxidoreductase [Alkalibacterium sp.]
MVNIGIILGSTRDARVSRQVAEYVLEKTKNVDTAEFEIVDIKDYDLPLFNETVPPAMANKSYENAEQTRWSKKIDELDGFIFITPEYNNTITPSLKNAFDYLGSEWGNKAAGIVTYGSTLGIAAQLSLRHILSNFNVATVGPAGAFSLFTDFEEMATFRPSDVHHPTIQALLETTAAWSKALKPVRA